ncbi:MAG: ribosome recycling factor [Gammaproteobacteria bacterium]|nr:ribosome recycling factor [Gammaproteobacteria bacterium]MDH5777546.1 ribosome recycling factor [Gammaproteobacteria bacterium]
MIKDLLKDAETRMGKSVESLKHDLTKIRTGRAHPSLLEHITVEYYGSEVPLSQVANISVADARMLNVTPWEKPMVPVVEKAIMNSDMGLNPASAGEVIRVPLPALTEERRKDMIKLVRKEGESTKVAIRNIRRDVLSDIKTLLKEKEITEDEERSSQDDVQKITDKYVGQVDVVLQEKEKDMMEI